MEAHPEVAYEADQRVRDHLRALVQEAPELETFFQTYVGRVQQERRQWAERLAQIREQKQTEQRFQLLAAAIPQQVWTAKPNGGLDYVNQQVLDYFGRSFEQMIGWGWQAMIHPEDLPYCLERWQHALTTGQAYEIEFRLQNQQGEYRSGTWGGRCPYGTSRGRSRVGLAPIRIFTIASGLRKSAIASLRCRLI